MTNPEGWALLPIDMNRHFALPDAGFPNIPNTRVDCLGASELVEHYLPELDY